MVRNHSLDLWVFLNILSRAHLNIILNITQDQQTLPKDRPYLGSLCV